MITGSAAAVVTARRVEASFSVGLLRRIFSFPAMIMSMLAALLVLTVRSRFSDPDLWWHLATGRIVWTTHRVPTTDVFSWTTHHHAWTPHEWLAQLSIYAAYVFGGYSGLMLWLCITGSALLIGSYVLCSVYSDNAKVAFLGTMVTWFFATIGLAIRPQMLGYVLLIVELILLHLGRTRSARWLYLLPPLFALWVNCHGSFFLGIIVAGVLLLSAYCHFRIGSLVAIPWTMDARRTLALMLPLSALALLLNPTGLTAVLYPIRTMVDLPLAISSVSEWQPLPMNSTRGLAMLLVATAILLMAVTRRAELHLDELLLVALAFWLAAGHQRMLFVFGILAAPALCRMLSDFWDRYDFARDRVLPNAVFMALAAIAIVMGFPNGSNLAAQVSAANPVAAVDYMKSHRLAGHLVNDYAFGGYLIWAAPEYPVFVDGRGDVFEWTGVLSEFGKWATLQDDPQKLLRKYDIDICLLERGSPMERVLPLLPGWHAVYTDDHAVIFVHSLAPAKP